MTAPNQPENPAELLLGRSLDGGWNVVERLARSSGGSGGRFSICYAVESGRGVRGFLKALDYSSVFQQPDAARALQAMTTAFNYERDLLYRCARMSRVVTALDDGEVRDSGWALPVNYLIFEWADRDSRAVVDSAARLDTAWCLRTLHHIAVGLQQLHGRGIAHQDLKPSNVLVFDGEGSKLADLGRSSYRNGVGPFDGMQFAGDWNYAPPEILYGQVGQDWGKRRLATDLYQLGSLIMFFFAGSGMTGALLARLDSRHAPQNWGSSYRNVLPFVRQAFVESIDAITSMSPAPVTAELSRLAAELCDPDPGLRGHPKNRIGHHRRYGLERYVSRLDLLAKRAELGLLGGTA